MRHPAINHQPGRRETTDLAVIRPRTGNPAAPATGPASVPDTAKFALTSVTELTPGFVSALDHG